MWSSREESLPGSSGVRFVMAFDGQPATFRSVVQGWKHDDGFRAWFNSLLADSSFTAFRWETPGVNLAGFDRPFEFVLLNDARLARQPDASAFAKQFPHANNGVATFANLGGDAVLVVPVAQTDDLAYGHLAAFVRQAPESQRHALWQAVGNAMSDRLNAQHVWLSTAGAGVPWLHVRLDDSPKYYGHRPYRQN
jgi:hypothetical protein